MDMKQILKDMVYVQFSEADFKDLFEVDSELLYKCTKESLKTFVDKNISIVKAKVKLMYADLDVWAEALAMRY